MGKLCLCARRGGCVLKLLDGKKKKKKSGFWFSSELMQDDQYRCKGRTEANLSKQIVVTWDIDPA